MKRRLAEVRCWSLSGFLSGRRAVRAPSGRWGGGDWVSTVTLLGFVFWFLLSVFFSLQFFSPFKFHIWSNYCLCTLLSWRRRKSVPLSGGAVPSHRTCILVTGLLRKPRCSRRKPAGETCLGYSWL